jgi:flagellar biosynthesis protein FlhA
VRAITMGPRLETALMNLFSPRAAQGAGIMNPDILANLLRELNSHASMHASEGRPVPLITPPALRVGVRRLVEPVMPNLPVISLAELPPHIGLNSIATWELANAA